MDQEQDTDVEGMREYGVLCEDMAGGWDVIRVHALDATAACRYAIRSTHWAKQASLVPHDFDYRTPGRRDAV